MKNSSKLRDVTLESVHPQVWKVLTEDEKMAISLSYGYSKSTWEAGGIMSKSHYKYMEIKNRAERFVQLFNAYFNDWEVLIRTKCSLDKTAREYIHLCVESRKKPVDLVKELGDGRYIVSSIRDRVFGVALDRLAESKDTHDIALLNLLREFDRWNNYRILPESYQELSAFKRRNKRKEIKNLKRVSGVSLYYANELMDKLHMSEDLILGMGKKPMYVPIISKHIPGGFYILVTLKKTGVIELLSKQLLYCFPKQAQAYSFADNLVNYIINDTKVNPTKEGISFWTKHREVINRSINFNLVNPIDVFRDYYEPGYLEADLIKARKSKKNKFYRQNKSGKYDAEGIVFWQKG